MPQGASAKENRANLPRFEIFKSPRASFTGRNTDLGAKVGEHGDDRYKQKHDGKYLPECPLTFLFEDLFRLRRAGSQKLQRSPY